MFDMSFKTLNSFLTTKLCKMPSDRVQNILQRPCKCSGGLCYKQFAQGEVLDFLNEFQKLSKQEQDSVLYLACQNSGTNQRREYFFLSKPIGRSCMEQLLGISSHRTDRTGQVDLRFGPRANMRPSELSASVDSFCAILYNSVAEPLPDRQQKTTSSVRVTSRPSDTDHRNSDEGTVFFSEFEDSQQDDEDLMMLLKSNDLSSLVRKYLPPGTIFEMFQFYIGWCSAHNIRAQAPLPGDALVLVKEYISSAEFRQAPVLAMLEDCEYPMATGQAAAVYLRALAANTLPTNELIPLPFHMEDVVEEMMPQPEMDPHPCVVAVLSPTAKIEDYAAKKRKTEWSAGLKKLEGNTQLAKDQFSSSTVADVVSCQVPLTNIMLVTEAMAEKMLNAFMRDCAQDFDAVLLSKPPNFKVEMLTMWQDHVLHMRSQIDIGLQQAEALTQKRGMMVALDLMDDLAQDTFVAFYSETGNPQVFQFATSQVKDKLVVLEETTSAGACDTAPMSLYDLWVRLEKEGAVNMKFTGYSVERPASVQRGEDSDSLLPLS
ncbi:Uncharacterized protein SCF082_LOCUS34123 [Durusdinium trenchii]|uniref:Uncharacterized protein n=1 Tax=Durusdinium trenchii TaxID=1381693 RepID=A0ABP0NY23_9DINO